LRQNEWLRVCTVPSLAQAWLWISSPRTHEEICSTICSTDSVTYDKDQGIVKVTSKRPVA
jgi:hypothetical protein